VRERLRLVILGLEVRNPLEIMVVLQEAEQTVVLVAVLVLLSITQKVVSYSDGAVAAAAVLLVVVATEAMVDFPVPGVATAAQEFQHTDTVVAQAVVVQVPNLSAVLAAILDLEQVEQIKTLVVQQDWFTFNITDLNRSKNANQRIQITGFKRP
jgi:hypothetical protein